MSRLKTVTRGVRLPAAVAKSLEQDAAREGVSVTALIRQRLAEQPNQISISLHPDLCAWLRRKARAA